ncbi:hypothetical protein Goshw_018706 [Gossypium schwendimanii]|uniref:RNase H type-1 domain-containing protein n=1 Tax=Gossypium schwendimanii TaxID=34291 RepID=A0A7J9LXF1_GOSSC|nr:hypothetical protein [Gossypium schwendimanii]
MAEYEGIKVLKKNGKMNRSYRIQEDIPRTTIHFDAVFDRRTFKSVTGLVGWDLRGNLLVLKTIIHSNVPLLFAAEAYACLEGTKLGISPRTQPHIRKSENSHAHRLAKNALDREETTYLMGEELNRHAFASEENWPRNPD